MTFEIEFKPKTIKDLKSINKNASRKIIEKIVSIQSNAVPQGIGPERAEQFSPGHRPGLTKRPENKGVSTITFATRGVAPGWIVSPFQGEIEWLNWRIRSLVGRH